MVAKKARKRRVSGNTLSLLNLRCLSFDALARFILDSLAHMFYIGKCDF